LEAKGKGKSAKKGTATKEELLKTKCSTVSRMHRERITGKKKEGYTDRGACYGKKVCPLQKGEC